MQAVSAPLLYLWFDESLGHLNEEFMSDVVFLRVPVWVKGGPYHIRCDSTDINAIHEKGEGPSVRTPFAHVRVDQLVESSITALFRLGT